MIKEGTYIDRDSFHWEQGMRRLVLGAFMTGSHDGDDQVFHLDDADYLPHDQPADTAGVRRAALVLAIAGGDARILWVGQLDDDRVG